MVEAHAVCIETQWLGVNEWLEKRERKWDAHYMDDILWGTGISVMAVKILARTKAGEGKPEAEKGMLASVHAGTKQQV